MVVARRLLASGILVLLLVAGWRFAAYNGTPVGIYYWIGDFSDVPLWMALIAAFGLGALTVGIWSIFKLAKMSLVARRYRKALAGLEAEVHQLRNLPLAADEEAQRDEILDAAGEGSGRGV